MKYYKKKEYDAAEMVVNSISYSYFNVEKATGDMTYFTNAASDLFAAMSLATIEDALRADEEENAVRLNEWKRLDPEEKQAHPFRYRNDNEKTINLYSMIVNFQELVSVPITKDGRLTKLDQFFEDRSKTDRAKLKYLTTYVSRERPNPVCLRKCWGIEHLYLTECSADDSGKFSGYGRDRVWKTAGGSVPGNPLLRFFPV